MRKFIKIILIIIGIFVGLVILATLILRFAFPPAKLRHLVEDNIRTQLHREAQLGDVQLGLTGLSLSRLRLSDVPNFSAGTFLAVDGLKIHWALLPLLSREVVIQSIELDKPQINLIRMADGKTLNISDLSSASPSPSTKVAAAPAAAAVKSHWNWQVNAIHLRQGLIRFDDRSPAHQTSTLSNIDLTIHDFDPTRIQGNLTIGELQNPVYTAHNFSTEWALRDIDPSLGHLNGFLRLKQGPGLVQNLENLVATSRGAKIALMPLVMLQSVGHLGLGLPDFSRLAISQIDGDYTFKEGLMTINTFKIIGPQLIIGANGQIELAPGNLNVDVALHTSQPTLLGEMDLKMHISGTLSNPKTNVPNLKKKVFKATVNQLINRPDVQNTLKNIFH